MPLNILASRFPLNSPLLASPAILGPHQSSASQSILITLILISFFSQTDFIEHFFYNSQPPGSDWIIIKYTQYLLSSLTFNFTYTQNGDIAFLHVSYFQLPKNITLLRSAVYGEVFCEYSVYCCIVCVTQIQQITASLNLMFILAIRGSENRSIDQIPSTGSTALRNRFL